VRGIGPKTALTLIKKHHTIEKILEAIKREKKTYEVSEQDDSMVVVVLAIRVVAGDINKGCKP